MSKTAATATTIDTVKFGKITVDQDKVITMATPFLGFPDSSRFILRPHSDSSPFVWLQSLDDPKLAFVMINPTLLIPDYKPEIPAAIMEELKLKESDQLQLMVILTIPNGHIEQMTANLLGPVAINPVKRLAKQVPLDPCQYDPSWQVLVEDK